MRIIGLIALTLAGCGGDANTGGVLNGLDAASIETPEQVYTWSSASAPNVYFSGIGLAMVASFGTQDGGCPSETVDGNITTYEGGCTDGDGQEWFGTAVVETEGGSTRRVEYSDFGTDGVDEECGFASSARANGVLTQDASGDFTVQMTYEGTGVESDTTCEPINGAFAYDYSGHIEGDPDEDGAVWSGAGELGSTIDGKVSASTVGEVIDSSICENEAIQGTTTIEGAQTVVITYDGATDCDESSTVTYSVDGVDMGELEGVSCATMPWSSTSFGLSLLVFGLARRRD